jgi:hypothetical protein
MRRQTYCLGRLGQGKTACPAGKQFGFTSVTYVNYQPNVQAVGIKFDFLSRIAG